MQEINLEFWIMNRTTEGANIKYNSHLFKMQIYKDLSSSALLDVWTEGEYSAESIPGAINTPLSDLEDRIELVS